MRAVLGPLLLVVLAGISGPLYAQQQTQADQQIPPLIIKSTAGEDLFKFYCSSCHGLDGKGRSSAPGVRTPPPDLTTLALRNGGRFPRARVEQTIREGGAREGGSHGTTDMPVWGWIFRGLDPSDALVRIRIENLVDYLESIQQSRGRRAASPSADPPASILPGCVPPSSFASERAARAR
jgi:mono/diheme cytochrome c family protein